MAHLLDSKNTYMHYFKNEDVKQKEEQDEKTRTNVIESLGIKANLVCIRYGKR